jgi:hypothetical protein
MVYPLCLFLVRRRAVKFLEHRGRMHKYERIPNHITTLVGTMTYELQLG